MDRLGESSCCWTKASPRGTPGCVENNLVLSSCSDELLKVKQTAPGYIPREKGLLSHAENGFWMESPRAEGGLPCRVSGSLLGKKKKSLRNGCCARTFQKPLKIKPRYSVAGPTGAAQPQEPTGGLPAGPASGAPGCPGPGCAEAELGGEGAGKDPDGRGWNPRESASLPSLAKSWHQLSWKVG